MIFNPRTWFDREILVKKREKNLVFGADVYRYYDTPERCHIFSKFFVISKYSIPISLGWGLIESYTGGYLFSNPRKAGGLCARFNFAAAYGGFVFVTMAGIFSYFRKRTDWKNHIVPAMCWGTVLGGAIHRTSYGVVSTLGLLAYSYYKTPTILEKDLFF